MRYKYRFVFFILLFLVCVCAYLFIALYEGAKNSAIEDFNARQAVHAEYAAKQITGFFDRWTDRLNYLAEDEAIVTLNDLGKKRWSFF
jgi:hypothetical protein